MSFLPYAYENYLDMFSRCLWKHFWNVGHGAYSQTLDISIRAVFIHYFLLTILSAYHNIHHNISYSRAVWQKQSNTLHVALTWLISYTKECIMQLEHNAANQAFWFGVWWNRKWDSTSLKLISFSSVFAGFWKCRTILQFSDTVWFLICDFHI